MNQVRNDYSVGYSTTGAGGHSSYILNELDVLGRMTQINDSNLGFYVNYQFDSQRLINVQTNGSASLSKAASDNVQYSYYANGRVKTITYPPLTDGSILKTEYTYNKALGWVESMKNTKGSSVLSGYTYSYDHNGNITAVTEVLNNGAAKTTSYGYDALNRLLSIKRPNGQSTQYTYDVRGNRLTSSESVSTSLDLSDTSYTYDLQNTLTGLTKNGNKTIFTYYADGLRYLKSTGTTHTQVNYDFSGQVITEEKLNGSTVIQKSSFVRGDRVLVKKDKTAAKDYYYLYNGHGDVVQIVNTSGTSVNTYSYDEWGNITSLTEGIPNSFKYAGEIYDEETGLYYLRARYYDPSIGRFLNEDTVEGQIDNPLSQNLYTYVSNNPLIYTDPTGHRQEIGGSAFESKTIGSNGVLYNNNGSVAWDFYLAWRNSDRLAFDKLANSGKGITKDQMMVMRLTLSFVTYADDGTLVLLMESDGQYGLAKGIMEKYGVKAGEKIVLKTTAKIANFNSVNFDNKQLGKKYGEHKLDYPGMTHQQYKDYANNIFKNPDRVVFDANYNEFYYIRGNDLLRVKENGDFISLYPGADSTRVNRAIE
ncbi:RHS repeat-associated core domain-containing protein [Paenibacillus sp. FSL L8-0340]|uniref:RHS repeat-associated core domain-containing protein n=1 Tax=Paenibacillus sp. FSL L8-0340 TaxID=2954685 RepID=UPI00315985D1